MSDTKDVNTESNTDIGSTFEGKVRSIQRTGDIRVIYAAAGPQILGPLLMEAWVCIEDGKIEWRKVPISWVSVKEYQEALA